jgi:hypothetical protein
MSDDRTTHEAEEQGAGPRREADDTTESDAGLTGAEGAPAAQPAIAHDDEADERAPD